MTPFDMSLVQSGARLRRSPYFEAEQRYGPKGYTVYNHMLFPIRYDDLEAEYRHLLEHVTLWDVAVERCLEISGPDGFAFAQLLTPRDLSACAVGQAKYVLVCAPDGGVLNDPVLTRMDENRFWLALASSDVLLYAKGLAANAGMDVELREVDAAPLQIQGPKSKDVVRALFGDEIVELRYYFFAETEVEGIPVVVTRTGWTSEVGYEVYLCDPTRGTDLWELILEAGRPHEIRPTGPCDIWRIEAGILNWGADMTLGNNVYEVGLDYLVDEGKQSDYIGREALARIKAEGVTRKLVGIEIEGDRIEMNSVAWRVKSGGDTIGRCRSAIYSPRLKKNIGYAMVPAEYSAVGTQLRVKMSGIGERRATVVPKPFIDPKKEIPKT